VAALSAIRDTIIGTPERLPEAVLRQHPQLANVRWRRGGLFPRVAGWCLGQRSVAAVTLWRTVFLGERCQPTVELLLHELRHVQQFEESRAFPLLYLWETVKSGYHRNRFECDAREYAATCLMTHRDNG
jgi:hypothetical protein